MKNELQNIYLNYKLDFIRADEIPNYIIDLLSKNIINDMIFWEIASLNKPYKNEIEDYFNILIAKKLLDEINDKLLIEISSYWWSCNLINNDKFLSVIENKKNTTSILRKDIEYFIYINYCDWDYEFKIKKEIKDILKKSIYYEVFDSFNLLKMNGETSSEAIHNETLIIKKKKLELKHIFLFICALPVFLFYIILTSIKYF